MMNARILVALLWAALCGAAWANVKLPAVFSDNMVLQHGIAVPVWGTAEAGEAITLACDGQQVTATADADGHWSAKLAPMTPGGPFDLTVAGKNTVTVKNVLVGEVWVCSGQSNMEFATRSTMNATQEMATADFPQIRMFTVVRAVAETPRTDCTGAWQVCTPTTVGGFSAVGYFFARNLYQSLNVPIGMIHTSWGGTPAEAWSNRETFRTDPALTSILDAYDKQIALNAQQLYDQNGIALHAWLQAADAAKAAGKPIPTHPLLLPVLADPRASQNTPTGLYNAMIAPLVPYGIAGAIWYQGEANAGRGYQYRTLLPAMIGGWRKVWNQGDFPFLIVQLANFMAQRPEPGESQWAELRESQVKTLALPKTGLAVAIDIGDGTNIHPTNKQEVGKRLALAARSIAYGQQLEFSGPVYRDMQLEDGKIRLHFTHLGNGLQIGLTPGSKAPLQGFAIAGADKKFVWANAVIDGNSIIVSSDKVATPVAVRYAWADNPVCNLYNTDGLPAVPFRTDEWQLTTQK